ncbi:hypothetical protein AVEN_103712-1 [Araneus ventricosus]|uniref:Uncharacterized protein n=1 Tax=Araneus ventricosus TaxID=182803 RepID=A0A4Y2AMB9_ARAVE|nr:hypothetical protein AVEN_103712-1 [Araneus ventricosus]
MIFWRLPDGVHCFICADDIFILVEAPTVPMVKNKIEASVSKLETWCKEWHLNIAPLKCKVINFSTRISPVNFPVCFSGECIPWSNNVRFLGIIFLLTFLFGCILTSWLSRHQKKLNAIKVLVSPRWGAKAVHLLRVCNACIIQALEFGAFAIGMNTKAGLSRLKTLQNNALRFVFGLPRWTPIPVLHKISNETNIQLRFDKRNISFSSNSSRLVK